MDGSIVFASWRQRALPCGHNGATCRIQLNLCFLRPTRVHNPKGESIGSAVFAQLTAVSSGILVPHGEYDWTCASFRTPESTTNMANRLVQPCAQLTAECRRVHRRHLANTVEFVLPSAHPECINPNGKSIGSVVSAQPPSNSWFLGPVRAHNPNGISIGSAVFAQVTTVSIYFTMGHPSPLKLPLSMERSGPNLIHGSLDPPESSTQTASRSIEPFLQGSPVWQTDRQITILVGNNRPHLRM